MAGGRIMLPSLGAAEATGPTAVVSTEADGSWVVSAAGRVDIPHSPDQDAPGWQGLHRISAGPLGLLIDDLDPFRLPGVDNLAPRLSAAQTHRWAVSFRQAWPLLEADHPVVAAEVREIVTVIVPLRKPPDGQVSCSSPQAPGAAGMSEPPDPCSCAVTLTHELQHQKLSSLLDMVPLTEPDDGRRYYAPWRDDPRPLAALLQGAYAHLGVTSFWRDQRGSGDDEIQLRAHTEFARWRAATTETVRTILASGQLTANGLRFARGMARRLQEWDTEQVPSEARAKALRAAQTHLARWQLAHGPVPN